MNLISNSDKTFGFMWEVDSIKKPFVFGRVQIIIGNEIYPKVCPAEHYTLSTVFNSLKASFEEKHYSGGTDGKDFGTAEFDLFAYESCKLKNIFSIDTSYMGMKTGNVDECSMDGLILEMGYSGKEERLFYSFDYAKTFQEICYPKGTVESVISKLPDFY